VCRTSCALVSVRRAPRVGHFLIRHLRIRLLHVARVRSPHPHHTLLALTCALLSFTVMFSSIASDAALCSPSAAVVQLLPTAALHPPVGQFQSPLIANAVFGEFEPTLPPTTIHTDPERMPVHIDVEGSLSYEENHNPLSAESIPFCSSTPFLPLSPHLVRESEMHVVDSSDSSTKQHTMHTAPRAYTHRCASEFCCLRLLTAGRRCWSILPCCVPSSYVLSSHSGRNFLPPSQLPDSRGRVIRSARDSSCA
jgi:hypothetical protein